MKKALITGITGQDGSYLTEFLLEKGYDVHGLVRKASVFNTERIDHLYNNPEINDKRMFLYWGDMADSSNLNRLLEKIQPDEIYNLAAQSHVQVSFEVPEYTAEVDGIGVLRFLDAIKESNLKCKTRFYQASTSELYGKVQEIPQTEKTAFYPRSPYSAAKLYAYWITKNYREAYGIYACNGILFNHDRVCSKYINNLKNISYYNAWYWLTFQNILFVFIIGGMVGGHIHPTYRSIVMMVAGGIAGYFTKQHRILAISNNSNSEQIKLKNNKLGLVYH